MAKLNTRTSVVDYLKSKGRDSSFGARTKLAKNNGISNYQGSYNQNVKLLSSLRSGGSQQSKPKSTPKPKPKPKAQAQTTSKQRKSSQSKPQAQTTSAPTNDAIERETDRINSAKEMYKDFLRNSSDSYFDNQKAMLDKAKAQRLAELEKAYQEAVQAGEMSKEEAEKAYQESVEVINEEAYLNSQVTDLSAQNRGIQNSQQMLAMQQGDQRHSTEMRSETRNARDERISKIRNRIDQITNEYNIDQSTVNTAYNADLRSARAQADQMFSEGMSNMTMAQYKNSLELRSNLTMQEQKQLDMLERMEKQYGYDLSKMEIQQGYDLEKMSQQQDYKLEQMDFQNQYELGQMGQQYQYDLGKMRMDNEYTLGQMAQQQQYDMSQMRQQFLNNRSLTELEHSNRMAMSRQEFNQAKKMAQKKADIEFAQRKKEYRLVRERELAKYEPGTIEYEIRESQLDAELERIEREIEVRAMSEAMAEVAEENSTYSAGMHSGASRTYRPKELPQLWGP